MSEHGSTRGISRRAFVKSAVAIGGASALAACMDREGKVDVPNGPEDLSTLPARQHAWNEFLTEDDHGNVVAPRHHVLLFLNYAGDGEPTAADREQVESAFQSLERAYQRGTGGDGSADAVDGLLFAVGYSPAYFQRYEESLPDSVDLQEPRALAPIEDPELDEQDAVVQLSSDHAQIVLAAEQALLGEKEELNGVEMQASLSGVFERDDRRTGFVGNGLPAENQDVAGIPDGDHVPEDSPLYMGFKSGFKKNQAREESVTIGDGPFANGATMHVSKIRLNLQQWYQQDDRYQRVAKMFCPVHAEAESVEGTGENLGDDTGMTDECVDDIEDHAREYGVVGHSQKSARARKNDEPLIIRRDFDSTDGGSAGLHFVAVQRTISDFVDTREAMNGTDLAEDSALGRRNNNGILQYMNVERRGNFLLPPREQRALPVAQP